MEEFYRNPLAAYSTQQIAEELARRRGSHVVLQLKVKLQSLRRRRKMPYKR